MAHLVIDGSNIATEGRTLPSLKQLDEAVRAFLEERPHDTMTVVVDATFEHRIDQSERPMYDEALAANELITPPAGTIGRGDKFLLEIAQRAGSTVFSNDSFQEFHGEYDWLFDEGRLIGGKPVPGVGWIFIERNPVRGIKSRLSVRASKKRTRGDGAADGGREAAAPTRRRRLPSGFDPTLGPPPVPTGPPPGPAAAAAAPSSAGGAGTAASRRRKAPASATAQAGRGGGEPVNEPLPFIEFIAEHPVGSLVDGEVVEFTSHGAYVLVGSARCYAALKFLADPAPRAARDVLQRGEVRTFVVQSLDAPRRGIDLALPGFEQIEAGSGAEPEVAAEPVKKATRKKKAAELIVEVVPEPEPTSEPVKKKATRKKKAAEPVVEVAPEPEPPPVKKATRKRKAAEPAAEMVPPEPESTPEPVKKKAARKKKAPEPLAEVAPEPEREPVKKRAPRKKKKAAGPTT